MDLQGSTAVIHAVTLHLFTRLQSKLHIHARCVGFLYDKDWNRWEHFKHN